MMGREREGREGEGGLGRRNGKGEGESGRGRKVGKGQGGLDLDIQESRGSRVPSYPSAIKSMPR